MMKKITLPLMALVLAIAASAFTLPREANTLLEDPLYWFDENGDYTGHFRVKSMETTIQCPDGSGDICERGYDEADLLDPDDPAAGLITNPSVNEVIRKP